MKYRIVENDYGFFIEGRTHIELKVKARAWFGNFTYAKVVKVWRRLTKFGFPFNEQTTHSVIIHPPLAPFKTLKEAREYLRKMNNPKRIIHEP